VKKIVRRGWAPLLGFFEVEGESEDEVKEKLSDLCRTTLDY